MAKLPNVFLCSQVTYFLIRFVHFFVSDDETQLKTSGSISQQDIFGEKLSNEQKIARFTKNDAWAFLLEENWDANTRNRGRHLR